MRDSGHKFFIVASYPALLPPSQDFNLPKFKYLGAGWYEQLFGDCMVKVVNSLGTGIQLLHHGLVHIRKLNILMYPHNKILFVDFLVRKFW